MNSNTPNQLLFSQSPYLKQHAYNPVDWKEWNNAAWELAKNENKLVLVSIGYSTCHWCHVMAHECFEDFETAELMNFNFINIKVDREERPDIDSIYMDACQIMTGRGGWPLNVICLPNQQPIYAGTYFPKNSWIQVLEQISAVWKDTPEKAYEYGTRIMEHLNKLNQSKSLNANTGESSTRNAGPNTDGILSNTVQDIPSWKRKEFTFTALESLLHTLDYSEGGVDRTPKFPLPGLFEFILDTLSISENPSAKDILHLTLIKLRNGGIYDAVRGGFCRYSTDAHWFAPHFEKMLYDNGQLLGLYAKSFGYSDAALYRDTAQHIIEFTNRELRIPTPNGFLIGSALDADSEGIEGKFYTFTYQELAENLTVPELELAKVLYGITEIGNWEHNFNIIHQRIAPLQVLEALSMDAATYQQLLQSLLHKLFQIQEHRIRPGFDYKIIVSWNALYLKGIILSAIHLKEEHYAVDAIKLGNSIWDTFWNTSTHRLSRTAAGCDIHQENFHGTCTPTLSSIPGFLEDYSFLADAFLSLYEISGDRKWIERSTELCEIALIEFSENDELPTFNPKSGETLIINKVDSTDDVIPSAVSVFAHCLQQLHLLGIQENKFGKLAESWTHQLSTSMKDQAGWHFQWLRVAQNIAWGGLIFKCTSNSSLTISQRLEIVQKAHQGQPSWTLVSWTNRSSESNEILIEVCTSNQCLPAVESMEMAVEIARDYLEL
jgi:uncharacterized protein YyaL (SSP411 family)